MIFCHSKTEWEELHLLLLRCFYANSKERNQHPQLGTSRLETLSLYCIANIEYPNCHGSCLIFDFHMCLGFDLQNQLASTIMSLKNETDSPFNLALVVYLKAKVANIVDFHSSTINSEQHILEKFADIVQSIPVTSDSLRPVFRNAFTEDIYVVTSELAGSGKSETISQMAYAQRKRY